MGIPNLTVQVLNLSPGMILDDLILFFSYCGTVEDIELEISLNKDQPRLALVTFKQPYAFQTALLLNGANFAGRPIQVLPLKPSAYPSHIDKLTNLRQTQIWFYGLWVCILRNRLVRAIVLTKRLRREVEIN